MEHQRTRLYSEAFEAFLAHTDEKQVLLYELGRRVGAFKASSMLDIGAGNGDLSIPLSRYLTRYVALEQKHDYAERLRAAGLVTIEGAFPQPIAERFDLVLACHSLPSSRSSWEPFLHAAWGCVSERGHLLLVTFEDEKSPWSDLIEGAGLEDVRAREARIRPLWDFLHTLGEVTVHPIETHVTTQTREEMLRALAFVWSDGRPGHIEAFQASARIAEALDAAYRIGTGYSFPFTHYLLEVRR